MNQPGHALSRIGVSIILLHVIVLVVHSTAHKRLQIDMNWWQNIFIFSVIILMPLVSGYLFWRRRRGAFGLLFVSMLGAFAFGGYYHFIAGGRG